MNAVRSFTFMVLLLVSALTAAHTGSAMQSDSIDCASFNGDQAAAQDYFDANGQPDFLDGNGDGQACADPADGNFTSKPSAGQGVDNGPSAGPEVTCGSFSNDQAAAQAYFDANGQPSNLDGNGDGQACADPADGDYTSQPSAGAEAESDHINCASFSGDQAAAQAYYEANGQPGFLDGNGDGQACADPEDGDFTSKPSAGADGGSIPGSPDNAADSGAHSASESVADLPVTGVGSTASTAAAAVILLIAMSVIVAAGAIQSQRLIGR